MTPANGDQQSVRLQPYRSGGFQFYRVRGDKFVLAAGFSSRRSALEWMAAHGYAEPPTDPREQA